ncbi:MAG TPA: 6-phosphogluconolactonase [Nocardioidaceae bacterium]|nr:6-phosphogluconolactonase [Nocardioidaceae bacterium]
MQRFPDSDAFAAGVAQALLTRITEIQAEGRTPQLVLTGGRIAGRVHAAMAVAASPVRWDDIEIWFGDERYVPQADPDRNAGQARAALLDKVPVDSSRVHEMPASDGDYADADEAALAYSVTLLSQAPADDPWFDILMLGVGDDGHCASLFPGRPEVLDPAPVVSVRRAPKPPPTRLSLGMGTLGRAREVWFVASGREKAEAVAAAYRGDDVLNVPAAGPRGLLRTVWFLDEDAAWML